MLSITVSPTIPASTSFMVLHACSDGIALVVARYKNWDIRPKSTISLACLTRLDNLGTLVMIKKDCNEGPAKRAPKSPQKCFVLGA